MEQNNNNFIWLFHRNRNVKTITEFMEKEHIYNIEPKDFFDFNRELIFQQMSSSDKTEYANANGLSNWPKESDLKIEMKLPCPCNLRINSSKVTAELAISQTNFQSIKDDFYAFAYEKIQDIYQNEGYKVDSLNKRNIDCQVFGWFKSLYALATDNGVPSPTLKDSYWNEFANLSRHVISLNTLVGADGGSFSLKLPLINADFAGVGLIPNNEGAFEGRFGRAKKTDSNYVHSDNEFYSKSDFNNLESNYFNWLVSSNDLLFISFEKLDMELKRDEYAFGDEDNFDIKTLIADNVFDMIALVDDVKVVSNAASGEAYVEVTGRDLMKLLIEDGSFFFNPSTTSNPSMVFANEQGYGKQGDIREADVMNNTYNNPINRLRRVTGEIDIFANQLNMDIGYIIKGVISQLSNIEVVPGYVFDSWGEDRTKFVELVPEKPETTRTTYGELESIR